MAKKKAKVIKKARKFSKKPKRKPKKTQIKLRHTKTRKAKTPMHKHGLAKRENISIKIGNDALKEADGYGKTDHKEIKKRVEKELREFEIRHKKLGIASAKIRGQDEHVDFDHIRSQIEKKIKSQLPIIPSLDRQDLKSSSMKTISSGIQGLDEILGGGLPENSLVLLSGTCGTGKSIFGMNFLIEGALHGEPGIYISLEESPESNIRQMEMFGWPVDDLINSKRIMIIQPELYNFDALLTTIEDSVDRIGAKRLVIDSISIIGMYFEDPYKVRKALLQLGTLLKKLKCTTIAIDEVREGEPSLSAYGVEEFVVDGVVMLYLIKRNNIYIRAVVVRKMRGMNHSTKLHPMEIRSPGGILIYPSQELFEEIV